jgi:hypothetical protein
MRQFAGGTMPNMPNSRPGDMPGSRPGGGQGATPSTAQPYVDPQQGWNLGDFAKLVVSPITGWTQDQITKDSSTASGKANTATTTSSTSAPSPTDKLQTLIDELSKPIDFNDPATQHLLSGAQNSAMQAAGDRGINGPLSVNMGEQAYMNSASQLQQGNRALALQGYGTAVPAYMQQQQNSYDDAWNRYLYQQQQQAGLGGLIGGGLGALGGFALGGPAGASAGWQAGSSIGGGVGSLGMGPPPAYMGHI